MKMNFDKTCASAGLPGVAPLTWLASAIEMGALWYFGRGNFKLRIVRAPGIDSADDGLNLMVLPLGSVGPMRFSAATTLDAMHKAGLFPARLIEKWTIQDKAAGCMVEGETLGAASQISVLAYGIADLTVDLFKRGGLWVKAQWSLATVQIVSDVSLDEANIREFTDPSVASYRAAEFVGQLPWPKVSA